MEPFMIRRQVKRVSTLDDVSRRPEKAPAETDLDPDKGPSWLLDHAARRGPDQPVRIKVEHLIAFWEARMLTNTVVLRILEELETRGLTAEPDLRGLELSAVVEIRPLGRDTAGETSAIGYSIGDIPSARGGLYCVNWDEPVTAMFDEMLRSGRDHVGVTDKEGRLIGCANLIEVSSAMHSSPETPAVQVVRKQLEVNASEKLFRWTGEIIRRGYVCVVDESGAVTGSVNCADITAEHERRMLPLSLIEEIEVRLRNRIPERIEVAYRRGRKVIKERKRPDDLTFGDYVTLIREDESFRKMGWGVPGSRLSKAVNRVRIIRNAVFHHKPGRPNQDDVAELEALLRTLEVFDGASSRNHRRETSANDQRRHP
jgi:restriction system protein